MAALGIHNISAFQSVGATYTSPTGSTSQATGSSFVVFFCTNGTNASTPTDSFSNVYTKVTLSNGNPIEDTHQGTPFLYAYVCLNGAGGANHTVTVSTADSHLYLVEFVEITGTVALDVAQSAFENTGSGVVNNPLTPTQAGDFFLACGAYAGSFAITPNGTGGTGGFTALENTASTISLGSGYLASATTSATDAAMQMAHLDSMIGISLTFKSASTLTTLTADMGPFTLTGEAATFTQAAPST